MKKNVIIVILIIIVILLVVFISVNEINNNKKLDIIDKEITNNNEKNSSNNSTNVSNDDINSNNTDNDKQNNTTNYSENKDTYSEADIINYTNKIDEAIDNNDSSIKDKLKDNFITIVDFIFYDKEIKGYKFSELTNSAKLKVIDTALKIDSQIDKYFPNYKETISDKYKQIKDKLVILYLDTTVNICSNNKDECDKAKELFSKVKDNIGVGITYIKEVAINGKNKLKDYYEIFRDS